MNLVIGEKRWWYIFEHPVTGEVFPVEQRFLFNQRNGRWELPNDQPSLPNLAEGSDFYETREEAMQALIEESWRNQEDGEEDDDGDTD